MGRNTRRQPATKSLSAASWHRLKYTPTPTVREQCSVKCFDIASGSMTCALLVQNLTRSKTETETERLYCATLRLSSRPLTVGHSNGTCSGSKPDIASDEILPLTILRISYCATSLDAATSPTPSDRPLKTRMCLIIRSDQ